MMSFTIRQIKLSWSELFVIAKSSVLSSLQVLDISTMPIGEYGSYALARRIAWVATNYMKNGKSKGSKDINLPKDGNGDASDIILPIKEQPVFTCQAHVFTINPSTRRSWVQASSKAIDINIFYDSTKQCYRIVSVEDGPTGIKVVINSTITSKMVFKQTSQKFGQWADPKSSGVFGLGFDSEMDLNKVWFCGVLTDFNCDFVAQFRQCVEATKQTNGESNVQGAVKQLFLSRIFRFNGKLIHN
ncbi:hypothetical protein ACTXT7_012827 [Hymenolepis weldensis]